MIFLQAAHTGRNARFRSLTCIEQWWQISQLWKRWKQSLIQKDPNRFRPVFGQLEHYFCQLLHCFLLLKSNFRHKMLNFNRFLLLLSTWRTADLAQLIAKDIRFCLVIYLIVVKYFLFSHIPTFSVKFDFSVFCMYSILMLAVFPAGSHLSCLYTEMTN